MKKINWSIKEGKEDVYSDEPFYDLFLGGSLYPEELLSCKEQIKLINDSKGIIKSYLDFLSEIGIVED